MEKRILEGYARFLDGYHWDWFLTVTFRKPRKDAYYAMNAIWREMRDMNAYRAFIVAEPFTTGDLHIHGLTTHNQHQKQMLPWQIWNVLFERFGRSTVRMVDSHKLKASYYVSKYVMKGQNRQIDHYEFFGESKAWRCAYDRKEIRVNTLEELKAEIEKIRN